MLGVGGDIAGDGGAQFAVGLGAGQQSAPASRLAHHAGGLGGAFEDELGAVGELAGEAQGVERLGRGGDVLRGHVGFFQRGGEEGGDHRVKPGGRPGRCQRSPGGPGIRRCR